MNLFYTQEKNIGIFGEKHAAKFLKKRGFKILERNWYNKTGKRLGEIDIICEKDCTIVFVEVKTRDVTNCVEMVVPEEQITPTKLHKLQRVAESYIATHNLWDKNWRFDAVSVFVNNGRVKDVVHIENIFF